MYPQMTTFKILQSRITANCFFMVEHTYKTNKLGTVRIHKVLEHVFSLMIKLLNEKRHFYTTIIFNFPLHFCTDLWELSRLGALWHYLRIMEPRTNQKRIFHSTFRWFNLQKTLYLVLKFIDLSTVGYQIFLLGPGQIGWYVTLTQFLSMYRVGQKRWIDM